VLADPLRARARIQQVSFNLAFWIGNPPKDDTAAAAEFERLHTLHRGGEATDARPELLAFISEITERYPDLMDLPDDEVDDGVWSDGPLTGNASGPLLYLGIVWSRVDEVVPFLVDRARARQLIIFDPQMGVRVL